MVITLVHSLSPKVYASEYSDYTAHVFFDWLRWWMVLVADEILLAIYKTLIGFLLMWNNANQSHMD